MNGEFDANLNNDLDAQGNLLYTRARDSARYVDIQNNYKHFSKRANNNVVSMNDETEHSPAKIA